jgi:hypothetical protein
MEKTTPKKVKKLGGFAKRSAITTPMKDQSGNFESSIGSIGLF